MLSLLVFLSFFIYLSCATVYVVGPNAPYSQITYNGSTISVTSSNSFTTIGAVSWYTLAAGDTVYIQQIYLLFIDYNQIFCQNQEEQRTTKRSCYLPLGLRPKGYQ